MRTGRGTRSCRARSSVSRGTSPASPSRCSTCATSKSSTMPCNSTIVLHRRDGKVLARFPHADGMIGESYADLPPFRDILTHTQAGTVIMDSPVDGSRRVLAIPALKAFPLAVNVSVDEGAVLAEWRRQTTGFAAAALAACVAIGGLVFLPAQRSRQVEGLIVE